MIGRGGIIVRHAIGVVVAWISRRGRGEVKRSRKSTLPKSLEL